ncbi:MAG: aldo/keto reductase, partial [Rhodospirillales bacterium]|nr:aldo/keto reductase [Rhodospirillales bacterium]
ASGKPWLPKDYISEEALGRIRALNAIAERRGQSLAQMALAWALRDRRITTVLIGASRPEQILENAKALDKPAFTAAELAEIDQYAVNLGINRWAASSSHK